MKDTLGKMKEGKKKGKNCIRKKEEKVKEGKKKRIK